MNEKMFKKFDKIFWEVGKKYGKEYWWEIFDGGVFADVEAAIAEKLGKRILNTKVYKEWINEMVEEL